MKTFRAPVLFAFTLLLAVLAAAPEATAQGWFGGSWFGGDAQPGTPAWWDANEDKAVFEPGKGYSVPGVDGYFDNRGRPIDAPVDEVFESFAGTDDKNGLLPGLDPKITYRRAKDAAGFGPDEQEARTALAAGQALLAERKFSAAAKQFEKTIDRLPKSALAYRAQFLLGECYFFQDRYDDARDAYEKVVVDQPNTRDMDVITERLWAIARYWEQYHFDYKAHATLQPNLFDKTRPTFDTAGEAIRAYEAIRLNDPTGPRADDAIMATAGIYLRQSRYGDADYHYSLLRKEYPRSEHQFDAHILGLQTKLRKYQGPDYDGTPLEEAKVLLKQIRTQFAGRLTEEEKLRLRDVQAEVQHAIEERELRMGAYYEGTEHYGAAKQYYARLAADHRGSPLAKQAEERLVALGGVPDIPAPRLAWFVDLFPQNAERSRVAGIVERGAGEGGTRLADSNQTDSAVQPASATETR